MFIENQKQTASPFRGEMLGNFIRSKSIRKQEPCPKFAPKKRK